MPMKMEQIECSETSAYINQTPGNHPKENTQNNEAYFIPGSQNSHCTSLVSRQITTNYEHSFDIPVSEMLLYAPYHNIRNPFPGLQ